MIRKLTLVLTLAALCGACVYTTGSSGQMAGNSRDRADSIAAQNAAAQLCGPGGVYQAPGTDGTNRSDYLCKER